MTVLFIGGAYQKKRETAARCCPGLEIADALQLRVREELQAGRDPMLLLPMLRGKAVICDEVGCGVIPIDRAQEDWREAVGRLCCAIAEEADAVVRVFAGIPTVIKGELPCC